MKAWQVLYHKSRFCTGTLCQDASGRSLGVPPKKDAARWDMMGAIYEAYGDTYKARQMLKFLRGVIEARFHTKSLFQFSDRHGYEGVVELLRELDI